MDFFHSPNWFLSPYWFIFLYLLWMSVTSFAVGVGFLNDKKHKFHDANYPRINFWLHLIPVVGFILGLYMLFTNKPLLKSESRLLLLTKQKQLSPKTRLYLIIRLIFGHSP